MQHECKYCGGWLISQLKNGIINTYCQKCGAVFKLKQKREKDEIIGIQRVIK